MNEQSVYDFSVTDINGKLISLNDFKWKVLLIVNIASACGYTGQLQKMQRVYEKYQKDGLEILAFPSNDFGEQEPLNNDELNSFCKKEYSVTFPLFAKINVRGIDAHPLYQYLSQKAKNGKVNSKPMWNFHKYIADRNGKVRDYFLTITAPDSSGVIKKIELLLNEKAVS